MLSLPSTAARSKARGNGRQRRQRPTRAAACGSSARSTGSASGRSIVREVRRFLKVGDADDRGAGGDDAAVPRDLPSGARRAAAQRRRRAVPVEFLAPGLIMMAMVQNAFANTTSSLMIAKFQGNIVDLLMPPLSPLELTLGLRAGRRHARPRGRASSSRRRWRSSCRCRFADPGLVLFHAVAASLLLSVLGIIGRDLGRQVRPHRGGDQFHRDAALVPVGHVLFDRAAAAGRGTTVALCNPFFYMIDGFRAGFIGHADGSICVGIAVMTGAQRGAPRALPPHVRARLQAQGVSVDPVDLRQLRRAKASRTARAGSPRPARPWSRRR